MNKNENLKKPMESQKSVIWLSLLSLTSERRELLPGALSCHGSQQRNRNGKIKDTTADGTRKAYHRITACSTAGRLTARIFRPAHAEGGPPLLVLHGISRNAGTLARLFTPEAERTGRTLIVPKFPKKAWPNFQRPSKAARPDQALLALLDAEADKVPGCTGPVEIFGHSGGAQLAHRFAMLYPHRVAALHLAAAGWYCLPDETMPYPYGLAPGKDRFSTIWARRNAEGLRDFLGLPICVYIGKKDVTCDPALRKTASLDAQQGPNRHARACTYVTALNKAAERQGLEPGARLVELTDCDHDVVRAITQNNLAARVLGARRESNDPYPYLSLRRHVMTLAENLDQAKWTFVTRRVDQTRVARTDTNFAAAKPGDLILAHVDEIGQHKRVQLPCGRPSFIFPGDAVVMVCGARYAPDQFEGLAEIDSEGADLLAGGGCIGRMVARNSQIRNATRLIPSARLLDASGRPVNLGNFALPPRPSTPCPPVIAVVGTSMNSGKTLATAQMILGLRRAGFRVGAIKITGTGAFGDYNEYADSGAHYVGDFTDAGMVTTYREPLDRIKFATETLVTEAGARGCDIVVMEVADGLLQLETAAIIADPWFRRLISGLVFACGDALAAAGGVAMLTHHGLVPDAVTGMVSCSPMASAEATAATGLTILTKDDLADPVEATGFALRAGLGQKGAA